MSTCERIVRRPGVRPGHLARRTAPMGFRFADSREQRRLAVASGSGAAHDALATTIPIYDNPKGLTMTTRINVWQAEKLARAMLMHDAPARRDDDLRSAHATLRNLDEDGNPAESGYLLEVEWEDGGRLVLWGDGTDVTDEYPVRNAEREL